MEMKKVDVFLWLVWLLVVTVMLLEHWQQQGEIQRLNGVVYELRMERSEWLHNIQVMEAKVASMEIGEEE